ncbi:enoyl-CoA hydratase/isomerase family protein [Microbacterium sp.]|uniref:enoyl-CoA hydratase/isomerase family protein n=1 Tax=Microbacterium sp. TaxID=51671 RepID=UPI0025D1F689|nr:enoyl-CoA hydratase/isomerase family protein [Microbacterium sp.]
MGEIDDVVRVAFGEDGVAEVVLSRPQKLNVVNLRMRDALIEAFTAVRDFPDLGALVLRAEGAHFSAGADISEFGNAESIFEARRIRWDRDPWHLLWTLPVPKIVALHGYALGSGLEMAMLCDVRIAAHGTKVGLPETKLGMLPAAGGTRSITAWMAPSRALPFIMAGEPIDAESARILGIVDEVLPEGVDVDETAFAYARRLAGLPRVAVRAALSAAKAAHELPLREGLAAERRLAYLTDQFNYD